MELKNNRKDCCGAPAFYEFAAVFFKVSLLIVCMFSQSILSFQQGNDQNTNKENIDAAMPLNYFKVL